MNKLLVVALTLLSALFLMVKAPTLVLESRSQAQRAEPQGRQGSSSKCVREALDKYRSSLSAPNQIQIDEVKVESGVLKILYTGSLDDGVLSDISKLVCSCSPCSKPSSELAGTVGEDWMRPCQFVITGRNPYALGTSSTLGSSSTASTSTIGEDWMLPNPGTQTKQVEGSCEDRTITENTLKAYFKATGENVPVPLHVVSQNKVVTIRGTAKNLATKRLATQIALENGAKKVVNLLVVKAKPKPYSKK